MNNGSSSDSEEYRSAYPCEVGIGAAWFGRRRRIFSIGACGTLESSVEFDIEGEWTRLAETWLKDRSSDTILATGLLV